MPDPTPIPDRAKAERIVRTAVAEELAAYSMVQDWNEAGFRVHALVAEMEWLDLGCGDRRHAMELAAQALDPLIPAGVVASIHRDDLRARLEHAAALGGGDTCPRWIWRGRITACRGAAAIARRSLGCRLWRGCSRWSIMRVRDGGWDPRMM